MLRASTLRTSGRLCSQKYSFLKDLGLSENNCGTFNGKEWATTGTNQVHSYNPTDGSLIASVTESTPEDYQTCLANMKSVQQKWQKTPAPARGEIVRQIGEALREKIDPLSALVSTEVGKIFPEGKGEVQEYVDICDFAVGLSRTMAGQVLPSERPDHFMMESWHPLGSIGIISAFNFPVAVSGWNTALSFVAGNTQIWKGAPSTPLSTIATQKIVNEVLMAHGFTEVSTCVTGGREVGELMVKDPRVNLMSFTGSCEAGNAVGVEVAKRFGKSLLELGGNNAIIVAEDADIDLAARASVFAAVGTCGQRCTTTRRMIVHESHYDDLVARLVKSYGQIKIGDPLKEGILMGPLHSLQQVKSYEATIQAAVEQGGKVACGGKALPEIGERFVEPTIICIDSSAEITKTECFAPILYVMKCKDLDEAIAINNNVDQGLSSSLFTTSPANIFKWTGATGSDCGIVNVNIPTNGAEIGGAFGGEKHTGGGRESGSDAWKLYCRRVTTTINYSKELPLAQGIKFE